MRWIGLALLQSTGLRNKGMPIWSPCFYQRERQQV
jgi:hypothetical protein